MTGAQFIKAIQSELKARGFTNIISDTYMDGSNTVILFRGVVDYHLQQFLNERFDNGVRMESPYHVYINTPNEKKALNK